MALDPWCPPGEEKSQEDVLDAAEDGGVKVVIVVPIAIFRRRNPRPTHACSPSAVLGRHVRDEHMNDSESESEDEGEGAMKATSEVRAFGADVDSSPHPPVAPKPPKNPDLSSCFDFINTSSPSDSSGKCPPCTHGSPLLFTSAN